MWTTYVFKFVLINNEHGVQRIDARDEQQALRIATRILSARYGALLAPQYIQRVRV
jgi:hypothetical protein